MQTRKRLMLVAALVIFATNVDAQVPPHAPGTICFTQAFWCWAQPPGPPGTPCTCPAPWGWAQGIRG